MQNLITAFKEMLERFSIKNLSLDEKINLKGNWKKTDNKRKVKRFY
jgi:hypothetical protein